MTTFEHAMCGATLAMALGCHRKFGWGLVATSGVAAALPDWDGLTILFGGAAYARAHRVWGHNLLAAGIAGLFTGTIGYLCYLSHRVHRSALRFWPQADPVAVPPQYRTIDLALWISMGVIAALTHLPADLIYSGHPQMRNWPVRLLWPFSEQGWVLPLVSWGDLATTAIFIAEMFAIYRWPRRTQLIAVLTLVGLLGYIGYCWWASFE